MRSSRTSCGHALQAKEDTTERRDLTSRILQFRQSIWHLVKLKAQDDDQQKKEPDSGVRNQEIRAALDEHWVAFDANDFETEHRIYHEGAVPEYPQLGERTRGRCFDR